MYIVFCMYSALTELGDGREHSALQDDLHLNNIAQHAAVCIRHGTAVLPVVQSTRRRHMQRVPRAMLQLLHAFEPLVADRRLSLCFDAENQGLFLHCFDVGFRLLCEHWSPGVCDGIQ